MPTLLEKKVLSITLKGSLAVPLGEPFDEPLLVPYRTLSTEGSRLNPNVFYLQPKRGYSKGFSYGDSRKTL
jgi:hypothetical protein